MTRVAAVDCGTNSVRLLVADLTDAGLRDVHRETRVVRLGEGVDRHRRLRPEAIARTAAALADYAEVARRLGAGRVRMVATSATRDAVNRDEFVTAARDALGVVPEVLDGAQEAALALAGVRSGLDDPHRPVLVVDVGGGSTELVGDAGAVSLDVGSVRLAERHLHSAPPSPQAVAAARADVRAALASAHVARDLPVVGVAATVLTVAALAHGIERYDSGALHGLTVTSDQVAEVTGWLLGATREQIAAMPAVLPGRVDVVAAGALVLDTVLSAISAPGLTTSERDLLDGVALGLA